jgi:hypothetical protein
MDLSDIKRLTRDNKTLAQWSQEVKAQATYFTKKYERCLYYQTSSIAMLQFYRKTKDTYCELNELLSHITRHDAVVNTSKCFSCKNDNDHIRRLEASFEKHYRLIIKCKDGSLFKRPIVLHHDI